MSEQRQSDSRQAMRQQKPARHSDAAALSPQGIADMQHSLGNRAFGELLGGSAPGELAASQVQLNLQQSAGNRAVQRMQGALAATASPAPLMVQRLTEAGVRQSTELTSEEQETFDEWLTEKQEVEESVWESRIETNMTSEGSKHPGAEWVKGQGESGKAKLLEQVPDITKLKDLLTAYKDRKAGTARGPLVKSKAEITQVISESGLAKKVNLGKFKELRVLDWKEYQKKFRDTQKKLYNVEAVSGFAHGENVYIVEGSQTMFTALHEALHTLSAEALQRQFGFSFNEGTTELITRATAAEKGFGKEELKYRTYNSEVSAVNMLMEDSGISLDALEEAYFSGSIEAVTEKLINKYGGESITKIAKADKLEPAAIELHNNAAPREKKPVEQTPEIMAAYLLEQIDDGDVTLDEIEEEMGKTYPEVVALVREGVKLKASKTVDTL